jgi:cysteine desulfurase
MRTVYMDNSATTPVDERVLEVMQPYFNEQFGNASSVHSFGRAARQALEESRASIAEQLGADEKEIIITSGGTEGDNLALFGLANFHGGTKRHYITAGTEHHAVLEPLKWLASQGYDVTVLPVDRHGVVDPEAVRDAIREDTLCVSIMGANNETGTIADIEAIAAITKEAGVFLHSDIVQTIGKVPLDVRTIPFDLLSISGHKLYGPKGIGAMYVRQGVRLAPHSHGSGHERGLRPGTENIPGAVGLAKAVELCVGNMESETAHLRELRDYFWTRMQDTVSGIQLNGHPERRLPGHLNVTFEGVEGESMLLSLDLAGVAASSGSACEAGSIEPSYVLTAMGLTPEQAQAAVRFTLGRFTTREDIDYVISALPGVLDRLRDMSAVG